MKVKTTQKQIRATHTDVIQVGYCNLQTLLKCRQPNAYTTRYEGWASDVYSIGNVAISTGYSAFGNIKPRYDLCQKYDDKARKIYGHKTWKWDTKTKKVQALLNQFIEEVTA